MASLTEIACEVCGKRFSPRYVGRKYCSRECMGLAKRKTVMCTCKHCGRQFRRSPSTVGDYCSQECQYADGWVRSKCEHCGKEIEYRRSEPKRYCSFECWKASRWVDAVCAYCGKPFKKRLSEKRKQSKYAVDCCSRDCRNRYASLLLGGDGTWMPGSGANSKRRRPGWRKVRVAYLEYVGWTCEGCGGRAVEVHHLVPYALSRDNSFDNLMAVCKDCHENMHFQLARGDFYYEIQDYLSCQDR